MLVTGKHKFVSNVPSDGISTRVQPGAWNDEHAFTSHTRADIPSLTITQDTFIVSGFSAAGDFGAGSIYTSVGAVPTGPQAIQDITGKWFNLVPTFGIFADSATYNANTSYWVQNNVWGKGALVNGVDFTQTIGVTTLGFPNDTSIHWSWPANGPIRGFPSVQFGTQPGFAQPATVVLPTVKQTSTFTTLTLAFDYTTFGPNADYNVIVDFWLCPTNVTGLAAVPTFEIDLNLYRSVPAGLGAYPIKYVSASPITADIRVVPNWSSGSIGGGWTFIGVAPYSPMTNLFSNTALAGGAGGSPGTDATNTHTVEFEADPGLTKTLAFGSTVAADGTTVNYVDVRWNGTTTVPGTIRCFAGSATMIAATLGQTTEFEVYLALIAGSWANTIRQTLSINEYDAGQNFLNSSDCGSISTNGTATTGPSATLLKYRFARTMTSPTVTQSNGEFDVYVAAGKVIDFTFRFAAPKFGLNINPNITSKVFDMKALLTDLISHSVITGNEYVGGIALGGEPSNGIGGIKINSYKVTWV